MLTGGIKSAFYGISVMQMYIFNVPDLEEVVTDFPFLGDVSGGAGSNGLLRLQIIVKLPC